MYYVVLVVGVATFWLAAYFCFCHYPDVAKRMDDLARSQGRLPRWRTAIAPDGRWYSTWFGIWNARFAGVLAACMGLALFILLVDSASQDVLGLMGRR